MKYRIFGKTGEKVSVLGYGNMRLPVVDNNYANVDLAAAMCNDCGQCAFTCPQGIDIPAQLRVVKNISRNGTSQDGFNSRIGRFYRLL